MLPESTEPSAHPENQPLFVATNPEHIGSSVPRRGNRFTVWLAQTLLRLARWRVIGVVTDAPKFIIIGAPHTSNWDFILVMLTAALCRVRVSWMGKHTLFTGPKGKLLRWLGGVAVHREVAQGIVSDTVAAFRESEQLVLCITPEGTRSGEPTWKSGFHRIAREAQIPILLAAFDYGNRVVWLGPTMQATEDYEADLAIIQANYEGIQGKSTPPQSL